MHNRGVQRKTITEERKRRQRDTKCHKLQDFAIPIDFTPLERLAFKGGGGRSHAISMVNTESSFHR